MSNRTPVFPMPEPHHFSDYGFDPQIDYFQVLEEARRHKTETSRYVGADTLQFKLQKPISKDESSKKIRKNKRRWWKNALLFFKWKWVPQNKHGSNHGGVDYGYNKESHRAIRGSISGPVYITESRSSSSSPYRTTSRPSSGPLAGTLTPTEQDEVQIPYISLREINMERLHHRMSTSSMPIYLVT